VGAKLLYTAFTISALMGLVVSWRLYAVGVADAGAAGYYAGAAASAAPSAAPADPGGGPVLDLPVEATARRPIAEQMPERKLLEVTHFHLFSVPVYVLILAHLWILARIPAWLQGAGVVASIATTALHLAAPWVVRGHAGLAWLMPVSGVAMLVTLGIVALVPTIDMWLPRARAERA
jgi:hypothetical protein